MNYDCVVIGLGGMGSSALYHLAKRGFRVCGLEQFGPVHDRGSSHGEFRIFRKAYFEHPNYVPLLQTAEQLWRQLEAETGTSLYHRIGTVLTGPAEGDAVAGTLAAARQHGLPVQEFHPADAARRWPMLRFSEKHKVILDADAGILAVEACVGEHLNRARELGAETCFFEPVNEWEVRSDAVKVSTDKGVRTAQAVVVAGGSWSQHLFGNRLPQLQVLQKLQQWHQVEPAYRPGLSDLPAFYFETAQGAFYGMPIGGDEVKLARHSQGALVSDPCHPGKAAFAEEGGPCEQFSRDHLRGVIAEPVRSSTCLYTVSPDGHFLVDHDAESSRVVFAAGFSGHGFKFASVMGEVLADLATVGRTEHAIDFLSARRFQ
ncbi:MAG: N-methyl-L-tryptophan oxidase [Planctomycetaceae bacterium]